MIPGEKLLQSLPEELRQFAEHVGFSKEWIEAGIVNKASIEQQFLAFQVSSNQNPDHFRQQSFLAYLSENRELDERHIDVLLSLRDCGADGCDMRRHRLFALIEVLSAEQLVRLRERHGSKFDKPTEKFLRRNLCCEVMQAEGVGAIFEEMKLLGDTTLETYVLEFGRGLTRSQAEWLSLNGSSRKVRNIAGAKLRHKRNPRFCDE